MTAALWCPTRVLTGPGATSDALAELPVGDGTVIVADAALAERAESAAGGRRVVLVSGAGLPTVHLLAERFREQRPRAVVALGGGSVIDSVKVAVAVGADRFPALARQLDRGPVETRRPLRTGEPVVVAVPTTIGTASEVSPVACVTTATGHRLVTGDDLRPQVAVLDPEQLATLPAAMVVEGALEVLLRVAGTAASGALAPSAFDAAVDLGRRILAAGDRARRDDTIQVRARLALLSAESRWSWSAHPADPFASRHWYAANELASIASIGKIAATLVVLPRLWRLLLLGERRLGDAHALDRFWRRLRPGRSAPPHEDVLVVAASWHIPPPPEPTPDVLRRTVDATIATWARPNRALAPWDAALASAVVGLEERTAARGRGPHPDSGTDDTAPALETSVGGR